MTAAVCGAVDDGGRGTDVEDPGPRLGSPLRSHGCTTPVVRHRGGAGRRRRSHLRGHLPAGRRSRGPSPRSWPWWSGTGGSCWRWGRWACSWRWTGWSPVARASSASWPSSAGPRTSRPRARWPGSPSPRSAPTRWSKSYATVAPAPRHARVTTSRADGTGLRSDQHVGKRRRQDGGANTSAASDRWRRRHATVDRLMVDVAPVPAPEAIDETREPSDRSQACAGGVVVELPHTGLRRRGPDTSRASTGCAPSPRCSSSWCTRRSRRGSPCGRRPGIYTARLEIGVSVFFLISGFLLYRPFAASHIAGGAAPATGKFWARRFLRIMPAYWLAFLITNYVMHIDTKVHPGWHSLLIYLGLVQVYFPSHALTGITQAWSLCTEVAFYLFLPLYAMLVVRGRRSDRHQLTRELVALAGLFAHRVGPALLAPAPALAPRLRGARVAPAVLRPVRAGDAPGRGEQLVRASALGTALAVAPRHALGQLDARPRHAVGGLAPRGVAVPARAQPTGTRRRPGSAVRAVRLLLAAAGGLRPSAHGVPSGGCCGASPWPRSASSPTGSTSGTRPGSTSTSFAGPTLLFRVPLAELFGAVFGLAVASATISYLLFERPHPRPQGPVGMVERLAAAPGRPRPDPRPRRP